MACSWMEKARSFLRRKLDQRKLAGHGERLSGIHMLAGGDWTAWLALGQKIGSCLSLIVARRARRPAPE